MSPSVPEMEGIYATGGILFFFSSFFEDAPLVEFMYPVFSHMPKGIQVSVVVPLFIWALLIPFAR